MKKIVSLLLCCVMLATLCVGCKDKTPTRNTDLTDAIVASDLADNYHQYSFAHVAPDQKPTVSDLQVSDRVEEEGVTRLTVTAKADTGYALIRIGAAMEYTWELNYWRMSKLEITDTVANPTAAPSIASVQSELANYMSVTGSALAIQGETRRALKFTMNNATRNIAWQQGAKTATLTLSVKTTEAIFEGYYNLTFDSAKGWVIETEKQESGQNYPVMHLTEYTEVITQK